MRQLRSVALVLLAACGGYKSASYVNSGGYVSAPPPHAIATDMQSGESYTDWGKNPWVETSKDHLSTFAADVDTASYTIARRKLNEGTLPPKESVRVEEFMNYFSYSFAPPQAGSPFSVIMDAAPSPLATGNHILRVGVATKAKTQAERKPAHLVFLVDVSGSMSSADKIGLAQKSLRILTENLGPRDSVSLVTYAGSTRVVLEPTGMENRDKIFAAIDELTAGGSTAMASGLDLAYEQAMKGLLPGANSRVIVLSDGDANVGPQGHEAHLRIIADRAKKGVTLSTIGFGTGNYKDSEMEQLANKGNGNNYYIDSASAARKVFETQLGATLEVVAKDVKLQVDFDPAIVAKYRLIGYENRNIADNDFRRDAVDAGEIGAGHQVTAMYELELTPKGLAQNSGFGVVRIRHKAPEGEAATENAFAMSTTAATSFDAAPADLRFAFAVAAFADVLRGADEAKGWSLDKIASVAKEASGESAERAELVGLVEKARALRGSTNTVAR
jgi:Ca-activated chloride channel family protein